MSARQIVRLQPVFLLHQRPYRDSSRIVELFSRDFGRIALVAKGARRPKSKFRPLLAPFAELRASWTIRSDLGTLTDLEPGMPARGFAASATLPGFYMNELLLRLLRSADPHSALFEHYAEAIELLAGGSKPQAGLRVFEKRLLDAIGYGLILTHDSESGAPLDPASHYRYRMEGGPVAAAVDDDESFAGSALLALASENLHEREHLGAARRLLARVLRFYLGDRPLKTGIVARQLRDASRRADRSEERAV